MTTAKLTLVLMKLVMDIRHLDHTVLPFLMVAPRLSTTMSMMLTLDTLLMYPMKDMLPTHQLQFTSQLTISQPQFTTQLQSNQFMPNRLSFIHIDVNAYLLKLIYEAIINASILVKLKHCF